MSDRTPGSAFFGKIRKLFGRGEEAPGGLLGSGYRILGVRRGGMGEVYLCESVEDPQTRVALKTFQKRFFFEREARAAFVREAVIWSRLSGEPHVLPAMGLERIDDRFYVRMPLVEREDGLITLRDVLRRGTVPPEDVLAYAFQIAWAMKGAAQRLPGVVHGDLKPENILTPPRGAMVTDFGLARVAAELKDPPRLESSWPYRAPESWTSFADVTPASDVYAFGAMLHELLTGSTPFVCRERETWRRAHLDESPPAVRGDSPISRGLGVVAGECLAKDPAARPDFTAVMQKIARIGDEHNRLLMFQLLMSMAEQKQALSTMETSMTRTMLATLLQLGESKLALLTAEALPRDGFDAGLWRLFGSALSLNGRDDEAVAAFLRALSMGDEEEEKYLCLSELALSYKRLERFDEAVATFDRLLTAVPESLLPGVITNFGTVLLAKGDADEAIRLLEPHVRKKAEPPPELWAVLGDAYGKGGRHQDALTAYQRALRIRPGMPEVLVRFARVSLEFFGRIDDAAEACRLAFQQGYESGELVVVYCACATLHGAKDAVEGTLRSARANLPPDDYAALEKAIMTLVVCAARVISGGAPEPPEESRPAKPKKPRAPRFPPASGAAAVPDGPTMPHLNTRFYVGEGMFSIDYYDDVAAPGYIDRFVDAFRRAERDGRMRMPDSLMRSTPFYFTICPTCGVRILSNRDVGKSIACHMCEQRHDTAVADDAALRELLKQVEQAAGRPVVDLSGRTHLVLLQAVEARNQEQIAPICRELGFEELDPRGPAAAPLVSTGIERRLIDASKPWSLWSITAGAGTRTQGEETPPEIERLLRRLRADVGAICSLSMSYHPSADNLYAQVIEGRLDEVEAAAREHIALAPGHVQAWQTLVFILLQAGQVDKAVAEAERFTHALPDEAASWYMLGVALTSAGRHADAMLPLRSAIGLDPTNRTALLHLAQCARVTGNEEEAQELLARIQSLGGVT